jgi:hypothetical protein
MFENSEKFVAAIGFTIFAICYTFNIKLNHLEDLQSISSSYHAPTQKRRGTLEDDQVTHPNNYLGISFEDLIQVHAATCNFKELSSKSLTDNVIILLTSLLVSLSLSLSLLLLCSRCGEVNYGCEL